MDKFVLQVALEYKKSLSKYNIDFRFPKSEKIEHTYHYRIFNSFVKNCKSSNFNEQQILEIIKILVKYMYKNRLLKKGIGILNTPDITDICINEIKNQIFNHDSILKNIKESCDNLNKITGDKLEYLLKCKKVGSLPNIVDMRNRNILFDEFICLSKTCINAYRKLSESDKLLMLSPKNYLILKAKIINIISIDDIKSIMGNDING